jgi:hypothetical protein
MRSVLATGSSEPSFFQALNLNHDAILDNHGHLPKLQVPQGFLATTNVFLSNHHYVDHITNTTMFIIIVMIRQDSAPRVCAPSDQTLNEIS